MHQALISDNIWTSKTYLECKVENQYTGRTEQVQ